MQHTCLYILTRCLSFSQPHGIVPPAERELPPRLVSLPALRPPHPGTCVCSLPPSCTAPSLTPFLRLTFPSRASLLRRLHTSQLPIRSGHTGQTNSPLGPPHCSGSSNFSRLQKTSQFIPVTVRSRSVRPLSEGETRLSGHRLETCWCYCPHLFRALSGNAFAPVRAWVSLPARERRCSPSLPLPEIHPSSGGSEGAAAESSPCTLRWMASLTALGNPQLTGPVFALSPPAAARDLSPAVPDVQTRFPGASSSAWRSPQELEGKQRPYPSRGQPQP